jgi:Ca2+-binding RTX toxin-like protein
MMAAWRPYVPLLLASLAGAGGAPPARGEERARPPLRLGDIAGGAVLDLVEAAKLTAADGAPDDSLGFAIAIDGDTVVVGAPKDDFGSNSNQGSAYVFVKPAGGWADATESARLTAFEGAANDQFGISVAISGDTVVVGSWFDDDPGLGDAGSAYVFVRPAGGWSGVLHETARLTASDRKAFDLFGAAVAIDGDTVVVGAPFDDFGDTFSAQGSAYVFARPPGGWLNAHEVAKLRASDQAPTDLLGSAVAVSGDTVVAGAYLDDVGGTIDQGSAYVFVNPGAWLGETLETAKLTAANGAATDSFGFSVAVDGDTVVAGAILHAPGGLQKGAVYVYVEPPTGWASTSVFDAELTASDGGPTDRLGESVAVAGDTVVAGARFGPGPDHADQGAVYLFVKPAAGWASTSSFDAKLTAADGAASDHFGAAVAFRGGDLAVGAWGDQFGAGAFQGSAYVFVPGDTTPPVVTAQVDGTVGDGGWYVSDVTVTWTVTDPESAVTATDGCETAVIDTDTAGTTLTCTATSAGGTESESVTIARDATAPLVTLVTPPDGASYELDAAVHADYACADALSGLAACAGPVPSGALIDTGTLGSHAFAVNASDAAGNQAQATSTYTVLLLCGGVAPTLVGTPGDDVLIGTQHPNVIHGLGGNDIVDGRGGDDVLCGGAGSDALRGGNGADRLLGGAGDDGLNGNGGEDVMDGGPGADILLGGGASDTIAGGEGDDTLHGNGGNDALDGGGGTDACHGNHGSADTAVDCESQTGIP